MKYWLVDAFNVAIFKSKLEENYNLDSVDTWFIYSFILNWRKIIAFYLRNVYSLERLGKKNSNNIECIDESLFTIQQGLQNLGSRDN